MNDINVAYLLIVHAEPKQVNVFVNQLLGYGKCDIYIHVDKKNISIAREIVKSPRVHIYSKYKVEWGSFEIVRSALFLMKKAVDSGIDYSHMYFGSGQDLMVKNGLYEFLDKHRKDVFIKIHGEVTDKDRASARYRVRWSSKFMKRDDWCIERFARIFIQMLCVVGIVVYPNKKRLKNKVKFYHGRTWFIAPADVVRYICKYIDDNKDYVSYWENSLASDLMFFQTIIMNSPYKKNVRDELMYVKFGKTFGTMNHPVNITIKDDERICKGNYYFARKFDYSDKQTIEYFTKIYYK